MLGKRSSVPTARDHALAVLRVRGAALALALLPAGLAAVLWSARSGGQLGGSWQGLCWAVTGFAVLVLGVGAGVAVAIARAGPGATPAVRLPESAAPELYGLVRDLARRLDVPAPSAIALTPDCDSWLEDGERQMRDGGTEGPPVLVIGSPFLWWLRIPELRALLAPVVAGTGPWAHPDVAAARTCLRSLDAAVARAERSAPADGGPAGGAGVRRAGWWFTGRIARLLLRFCGPHSAEMERGVAAAAADRAKDVDPGVRKTAQEQIGLGYAGWDRLLTRVALPAWRAGRWPVRLHSGMVSALTELSQRDRLATDLTVRLGERPACDLLKDPEETDASLSLLAARLFHGEPRSEEDADWEPVGWSAYPEQVVDRGWRAEAVRLFEALDATEPPEGEGRPRSEGQGAPGEPEAGAPVVSDMGAADGSAADGRGTAGRSAAAASSGPRSVAARSPRTDGAGAAGSSGRRCATPTVEDVPLAVEPSTVGPDSGGTEPGRPDQQRPGGDEEKAEDVRTARTGPPYPATLLRVLERLADSGGDNDLLAVRVSAAVTREDLAREAAAAPPVAELLDGAPAPLGPPVRPRQDGRELLAEHVAAAVCCAAVDDSAAAGPGLDWLEGPVLLVDGARAADLSAPALALAEDGDPGPLRDWLRDRGIRTDKPLCLP